MAQRKKDYGQYYSHSSLARDLRESTQIKRPKKKVKRLVSRKPIYKSVGQTKANFPLKVYITIGMIFSFAIALIAGATMIQATQTDIFQAKSTLKSLSEQNTIAETQIPNDYKLDEIEQAAKERLGMDKPKPHQIVYIDIRDGDYAEQLTEPEVPKGSIFEKLIKRY